MPFVLRGRLKGAEAGIRMLDTIGRGRSRILRKAFPKGAKPILDAAKAKLTPGHGFESGLEQKSLGTVIRSYRNGERIVAVIGPRTGMKQIVVVPVSGRGATLVSKRGQRLVMKTGSVTRIEDPALIGHLIEGGTKPHALGDGSSLRKGVQHGSQHPGTTGIHFMRDALAEQEHAAAAAIVSSIQADLVALIKSAAA